MKDRLPFVFAGLWDSGMQEGGKNQSYGTIITTSANKLISPVHHRMPVILPPDAIDTWLDPSFKDVGPLLQPYPDDAMAWYPVSDVVNSPRNDSPELIKPFEG